MRVVPSVFALLVTVLAALPATAQVATAHAKREPPDVAGNWRDLGGTRWQFGADGVLVEPGGRTKRYVVSKATSDHGCDHLTIDGERLGVALRGDAMWMVREHALADGTPIPCDRAKADLLLVRERPGNEASSAALSRVSIAALPPDGSRWGGRGDRIAISFENYGLKADPVVFPESAALVREPASGASCTIDGGIWSRDAVWLGAGESLVAFVTFSGSSAELEIYRTRDCQKTAHAPVSPRGIHVSGDRIEHDGYCEPYDEDRAECFPADVWRLRPDGTLEHLAEESEARTRGFFGAAFTGRADVERPWTCGARVVPRTD